MRKHRTFEEVKEDYFHRHPEEIDEFVTVIFEEYAKDGDTGALLASLRTVSRVKGITAIAEETGISRNGIQKALSETGNPEFASVNAILHAIGYSLVPQRIDSSAADQHP
jgi:probable addiction module antidote protein